MNNLDERYICAYLCNKHYKDKFCVLINFYNEVSRISLKTKDSKFMQIRLQWFIDRICNLYKNIHTGFPLLDNLLPIINNSRLNQLDFISILEAKAVDKDYLPFNNIEEYITYCENTGGLLWKMVMQMYGGNKEDQKAAYYTGTAFAILGNVRNLNFDIKRMHYKLVFDKNLILKGNELLYKEIKNNIKILNTYVEKYISLSKKVEVNKKFRRLLLLNVFSKGYNKTINKCINDLKLLNPNKIPFTIKIEFFWKYILNKY